MGERIYMDHAAGSPLRPAAEAALLKARAANYGNPGSPHREGQRARAALERARAEIGRVLGVPTRSVIFTGGGSEAARIALIGAAARGTTPLVCSALEHPAIAGPAKRLAARGYEVRVAPVHGQGITDSAAFLALSVGCGVASLLAVHHETGSPQPLAAVGPALRDQGTVLVCDAALAPGRVPLAPILEAAPLVAFSAHKFGGPVGVGILVVAPGTRLDSPACGGVQEEQIRGGTPDVAGALATSAALVDACDEEESRAQAHARFAAMLRDSLSDEPRAAWVTHAQDAVGVHCLEFAHRDGETLMMNLDLLGVAVATGSSCALGGTDLSPGLLAMGLDRERAARTIRISFGWNTTDADVKSLCERIRTTL